MRKFLQQTQNNRFDEQISISIHNKEVRFEAKHQEKTIVSNKDMIENVCVVRNVEFPFPIDLDLIVLKPNKKYEGLELVVQKPTDLK